MHHLDRCTDVDDHFVERVAARADERPEAERRPEPLAASGDEVAQRDERLLEVGVDGAPPRDLVIEQRENATLGAYARVGETGRKRHGSRHLGRCYEDTVAGPRSAANNRVA